jgi:hypothetical protein
MRGAQKVMLRLGLLDGEGIALVELHLVPIGVGERAGAGFVESGYLVFGELPTDGAEVSLQLLFVACADDESGDGGPA